MVKNLYLNQLIQTQSPKQDTTGNSDGYQWKYLYTISPSDIVKFVTTSYIPLPEKWGDTTNATIKDAAVDGKIETVVIKNGGSGYSIDDGGTVSSTKTISNSSYNWRWIRW